MSSLLYEIPSYDPETELQFAFQLILKAFEKKSSVIDQDMAKIKELIKSKDLKIQNTENILDSISKENKVIKSDNEYLKQENEYLIETVKKLNEENNNLIKFKNTIIASLDMDSSINKAQLAELLESRDKKFNEENLYNKSNVLINSPINHGKSFNNSQNLFSNNVSNYAGGFKSEKSSTINSPIVNNNNYDNLNQFDTLMNKLNSKYPQALDPNLAINENSDNNFKFSKFDSKFNELKRKLQKDSNLSKNSETENYNTPYYNNSALLSNSLNQNDHKISNTEPTGYQNKSNQYILASKFFNECKISLRKEHYDDLVLILKEHSNNKISEEEVYRRVEQILVNNPKLFKDFRNIVPYVKTFE